VKEPPWNDPAAPLQVTAATPESASEAVPVTEIVEVLKIAPAAGEAMLSVGAVLSRLILTEAGAEVLPAMSTATPEIA
jgi:hypothetical protein